MPRQLVITLNALQRKFRERRISRFLSNLARPHVASQDLAAGYAAMAADQAREAEAHEWSENLLVDRPS